MLNPIKNILIVLSAGFIFGCASLSPRIALNPDVTALIPLVGEKIPLSLKVTDARTNKIFGQVPGKKGSLIDVQSTEPLEAVLTEKLITGLQKAGFQIMPAEEGIPSLEVKLTNLQFTLTKKGGAAEITTKGELSTVGRAGRTTREKSFKSENGKKWAFKAPLTGHQDYLNLTLKEMLDTLLEDENFLTFLSSK